MSGPEGAREATILAASTERLMSITKDFESYATRLTSIEERIGGPQPSPTPTELKGEKVGGLVGYLEQISSRLSNASGSISESIATLERTI